MNALTRIHSDSTYGSHPPASHAKFFVIRTDAVRHFCLCGEAGGDAGCKARALSHLAFPSRAALDKWEWTASHKDGQDLGPVHTERFTL